MIRSVRLESFVGMKVKFSDGQLPDFKDLICIPVLFVLLTEEDFEKIKSQIFSKVRCFD